MDEVTAAHSSFLARMQRQCFLQQDKTWRLLQHAVHAILNMVLAYTHLQAAKLDPVQVCAEEESHGFLMLVL